MECRDIPIACLEDDEFGIEKYVESLCRFIRSSDTPITIALQGEWGCGKSSFMRVLDSCLCSEKVPEDERFDSIWLETWDLFLENDSEMAVKKLVLSLFSQLEAHFSKLQKKQNGERHKELIKQYMKTITSLVLSVRDVDGELTEKFMNVIFPDKESTMTVREAKQEFASFLTGEVEEKGNGVTDRAFIVFVDDLDRLEPKLAITLLEALKNLFDVEKCIFILAIDQEVIANGIMQKYGVKSVNYRNIGKDFFDKLIQVPYMIPMSKYDIRSMVINRLKLIHFFPAEYDCIKYEDTVIDIVQSATNKNPRAIKRLLNMVHLMLAMETAELSVSPEFRMLELLLMALQLAFPKVYSMLSRNQNLADWNKCFFVGEKKIPENVREQFKINSQWKEIIYLAVADDETIVHNYYRVENLLEIYETLQKHFHQSQNAVGEALGIVNVICSKDDLGAEVRFDGQSYDRSSQTQFSQGKRLLDSIDFSGHARVLDVGCGSGSTTMDLWSRNRNMRVDAFDISESQIESARKKYQDFLEQNRGSSFQGRIDFKVLNALELKERDVYDLIFSNATLHWVTEEKKMYRLLYDALAAGGELAVHQGGYGTYDGLHQAVRTAAKNIGLENRLDGWRFPAFYPKKPAMEELLKETGFADIRVEMIDSDERGNKNVAENFANASLLYYRRALRSDEEYEHLKEEFFRVCRNGPVDKTSHRLYIHAVKPRSAR